MATIEKVAEELRNLNDIQDGHTDLLLEGFSELNVGNDNVVAELVAIKGVLETFSNSVPTQIVEGFEKVIIRDQKREEKVSKTEQVLEARSGRLKVNAEEEGGFFKSNFQKGKEGGLGKAPVIGGIGKGLRSSVADAVVLAGGLSTIFTGISAGISSMGSSLMAMAMRFRNSTMLASLGNGLKALTRLFVPVVGTINGLIDAFTFFQNDGRGLGFKLMSSIEGFIGGFAEIVLAPIDFVMNTIGDFFGIEFLQRFSAVEEFKFMVELLFNAFEDAFQYFGDLKDQVAESAFGQAISEAWGAISSAFDSVVQSLVDAYNKIAQYVPGLPMIGEDTREKGPTSEDFKMERREAREAGRAARDSGLYDRNLIGESTIDREKVADAPTTQLKVILNEGDLSDEDHMFVYEEYKKREERTRDTEKEITTEATKTGNLGIEPPSNFVQQGTVNGTEVLSSGKREAVKVATNTVAQALNRAPAPAQSVVESFSEQTGVTVENAVEGAVNTVTSMAVGGVQENVALSEMMTVANDKYLNNIYNATTNSGGGSQAVVVQDNSSVNNQTQIKQANMVDPRDKADRSHRLGYRGRQI